MRFRYFFLGFLLVLPLHTALAAGASIVPRGPATVSVGQTFTVTMGLANADQADTVRLNGTYSADLLSWQGAVPAGVFGNISPASSANAAQGTFSFGAFSLDKTAKGTGVAAVMTFRATQPGTAVIQLLPSSRVLSDGKDQLVNVEKLTIVIKPQTEAARLAEGALTIFSPTHPDQNAWYSSRQVIIGWDVGGVAVRSTYFNIDRSPEGPSDIRVSGASTTQEFTATSDGVWYAHLTVIPTDGVRLRKDFRLLIDATAPKKPVPVTDLDMAAGTVPNTLRFASLDETSGIEFYRIAIDGKTVSTTTANAFDITGLQPGQHLIQVTAFDRAKNVAVGVTQVTVQRAVMSAVAYVIHWVWLVVALLFLPLAMVLWYLLSKRYGFLSDRKKKFTRN